MKHTYKGFLRYYDDGEGNDILFLEGNTEPLAERLEDDISGKFATVSYYISDKKVTFEEAQESFVNQLFGKVDAEYDMLYSEITGYLWTDEKINVGGHNLLEELSSYVGKYLILIADLNNPQEKDRLYKENIHQFKMTLNRLDKFAEELGTDRETLIKQIKSGKI